MQRVRFASTVPRIQARSRTPGAAVVVSAESPGIRNLLRKPGFDLGTGYPAARRTRLRCRKRRSGML